MAVVIPKSLIKLCKKYHVRLTLKRNGKRVYKSQRVLKKQLNKKIKKRKSSPKRNSRFGFPGKDYVMHPATVEFKEREPGQFNERQVHILSNVNDKHLKEEILYLESRVEKFQGDYVESQRRITILNEELKRLNDQLYIEYINKSFENRFNNGPSKLVANQIHIITREINEEKSYSKDSKHMLDQTYIDLDMCKMVLLRRKAEQQREALMIAQAMLTKDAMSPSTSLWGETESESNEKNRKYKLAQALGVVIGPRHQRVPGTNNYQNLKAIKTIQKPKQKPNQKGNQRCSIQ